MMNCVTRSLALLGLLFPAALSAGPDIKVQPLTRQQRSACERLPVDFGRSGTKLRMVHATVGKDGKTLIEKATIDGDLGSYYQGKVRLTQFGLGDPTKVTLVYGHPGIEIPPHPAPYKELFVIIGGSSIMRLADGRTLLLKPGSLFLADDAGGPPRGGAAGPCGYVAIALQFKPVAP